jgi:hypothetical protein
VDRLRLVFLFSAFFLVSSIAKLALGNKAVKHGEMMAIKTGPLKLKIVLKK